MFSHLQKYDLEEETSSGEDMLPGLEMNPKRPVPGIDGSSFVGSTIRPKGKGDVPSKAPDDGVLALMREHGLITVKSVKDDGSKEAKYSWPAMGPSAVRDSLSFQLNRFWNPRDKSTFPSSYTEQLDVVETLTDGFPFAPHDDPSARPVLALQVCKITGSREIGRGLENLGGGQERCFLNVQR